MVSLSLQDPLMPFSDLDQCLTSPSSPLAPPPSLEVYIDTICTELPPPILPLPAPYAEVEEPVLVPLPTPSVSRNARIAGRPAGLSSELAAQALVALHLGSLPPAAPFDDQAREAYLAIFARRSLPLRPWWRRPRRPRRFHRRLVGVDAASDAAVHHRDLDV